MGRIDHHAHADAGIARNGAGLIHGAVSGQVAKSVIGIDEHRGATRMRDLDGGVRLADAVAQAIGIEGQEPDAMAVDTEERCMDHGAGSRLGRPLIGAGRIEDRKGKGGKLLGGDAPLGLGHRSGLSCCADDRGSQASARNRRAVRA